MTTAPYKNLTPSTAGTCEPREIHQDLSGAGAVPVLSHCCPTAVPVPWSSIQHVGTRQAGIFAGMGSPEGAPEGIQPMFCLVYSSLLALLCREKQPEV